MRPAQLSWKPLFDFGKSSNRRIRAGTGSEQTHVHHRNRHPGWSLSGSAVGGYPDGAVSDTAESGDRATVLSISPGSE